MQASRFPLALLGILVFLLASGWLESATFNVTHTGDSGAGSLRQAILDANALTGPDVIEFKLTGTAPNVIRPLSPLPLVTDTVIIAGSSQNGFVAPGEESAGTFPIEISGSQIPDKYGLSLLAGDSTVEGLFIYGFREGAGIILAGMGNNSIYSNRIGTTASGQENLVGIRIKRPSGDNTVGGPEAAFRNSIVGNRAIGIEVGDSDRNRIEGNLIQANGTIGISIVQSDENEIVNNEILDSGIVGLYLDWSI